jgi:photosystem II stability/assembly factor-like uncharacterized protein
MVMRRAIGAPALLAALALAAAGCASAAQPAANPSSSRSAPASSNPSPSPSCGGSAPPSQSPPAGQQPGLSAIQFVSPSEGWAVGSGRILHTTDGGRHWRTQFVTSAAGQLRTVDFTDARHGWVAGATQLLATTDGGAHWRTLPEPCQAIRSVHFINSLDGVAVAGGTEPDLSQPPFIAEPQSRGILLRSTDGGLHWRRLPAPPDVQTACFSSLAKGWLGARGNIYGTVNGGQSWTLAVASHNAQGPHGTAEVECAGSGAAWAEVNGPGVGMSHMAQIGYHTSGTTWRPIYAEQYTASPSLRKQVRTESPGGYPGPFSAISRSQAAYIGWCPPCTAPGSPGLAGPAPLDIARRGGALLIRRGRIAGLTQATGAAFLTVNDGWVVGIKQGGHASAMIVHTSDGGRTWQTQYVLVSG